MNSESQTDAIPLVISGPSGSGKGTLTSYLLKEAPSVFALSASYTTRKPREGEVHGVHYYFVSEEEFLKVFSAKITC